MLWNFTLCIDHKPLTFALKQNLEKWSPRQFRYLDFIRQYITDIRNTPSDENKVADALSPLEATSRLPDHSTLEKVQEQDQELKKLLVSKSYALQFRTVHFLEVNVYLYCDTSNDTVKPYAPRTYAAQFLTR